VGEGGQKHQHIHSIKLFDAFNMKLRYVFAVYSLFALSEYMLVTSNILFHGMAFIDFGEGKLVYVDNKLHLPDKSL